MDLILQALCVISAVITLWMIGDKNKYGFIVGAICQVIWIYFFLTKRMYLMPIVSVIYAFMYVRGYIKWQGRV